MPVGDSIAPDRQDVSVTGAAEQWEYFVGAMKVPALTNLEAQLNRIGSEGWEVVSVSTTVKTMVNVTGNDMVVVCKRRCVPLPPPAAPAADWYDDPSGRFDKRYWDGGRWTVHVGRVGPPKETSQDPPTMAPPTPKS